MSSAEIVIAVWGVLVALTVGSFICVIIDRLPLPLDEPNQYGDLYDTRPWREVFGGTSRCSSCGESIRPSDNIPIVGWLRLRGACRGCGDRIPAFHPIVELAVPLIGIAMVLAIGREWLLLPALFLVPVGVAVSVIDIRTLIVPTKLVWPSLLIQVVLCGVVAAATGEPTWLLGGAAGVLALAGPLFAIWWIHPRGMGFGDVRLAVLLGWSVGFAAAAQGGGVGTWALLAIGCMLIASVVGIVFGMATLTGFGRQFPFGPSLVTSALICMAFAGPLLEPFIA